MIDQEPGSVSPPDCDRMGWPTDVRPTEVRAVGIGQRALLVIAVTRYEWALSGAAPAMSNQTNADCSASLHPLSRLTQGAKSGRGATVRPIRARFARRS